MLDKVTEQTHHAPKALRPVDSAHLHSLRPVLGPVCLEIVFWLFHVRPSVCLNHVGSHWTGFRENVYWRHI